MVSYVESETTTHETSGAIATVQERHKVNTKASACRWRNVG